MAYTKFSATYRSANKKNRIHYYIFEPETELRAIIQFTHGWKDYIERNMEIIRFFTDHGIMVCGCDFIGHGRSAEKELLGHLDRKNGWSYLVKDARKLSLFMQAEYPGIPFFLYGHGMGSLVARLCCINGELYDGVILSGTSGKQKYCRRAVLFTSILRRIHGGNHRSGYVEKLIYRRLNRKFRKENDELSWFSEEENRRRQYERDERCNFTFTVSAMENIFAMLSLVSTEHWYRSVSRNLPILLVSGKEDPVGDFGKGVTQVYDHLCRNHTKVEMYLYENVRHELQEDEKNQFIFEDILSWMKQYLKE